MSYIAKLTPGSLSESDQTSSYLNKTLEFSWNLYGFQVEPPVTQEQPSPDCMNT